MKEEEKIIREAHYKSLEYITRRHFLKECRTGIGLMGLGSLLAGCDWFGSKNTIAQVSPVLDAYNPLAPKLPHFPGKAKSVIYLHMAGAPSQLELFDYKPELLKLNGKDCPQSLLE